MSTTLQAFQFEGIGYVAKRSDMARLPTDGFKAAQAVFEENTEQFAAFGFSKLETVYVTEDDEQGACSIKCFVCVRLVGAEDLPFEENNSVSCEFEDLLEKLATTVCMANGVWLLHPENWELASINDPTDC